MHEPTGRAVTTHDGIVLGAGHNGLILQVYCARAGLDVLCLERRTIAGGALTTEENPRYPGFLHNTHAFFHRALTDCRGTATWSSPGTARATSSPS